MPNFDKIIGTMLLLIFVFLVLSRSGSFSEVVNSISRNTIGIFGTLQGREVTAGGTSVGGVVAGVGGGGGISRFV